MSEQVMGPAERGGDEAKTTRSGLLRAGGIAAIGTAGALALTNGASAARTVRTASNGSILDKWTSSKKARLGVDLTFPPLQFIDPKTKKPSGYIVELTELMMSDLGVTPGVGADAVRAALRGAGGREVRHDRHRGDDPSRRARCRGTSPTCRRSTSRT